LKKKKKKTNDFVRGEEGKEKLCLRHAVGHGGTTKCGKRKGGENRAISTGRKNVFRKKTFCPRWGEI